MILLVVTENSKESKQHAVLLNALEIAQMHGLAAVTFARVARASGVSRSWIYKYVGSTQEAVLEAAVDFFGKAFSELAAPSRTASVNDWTSDILEGSANLIRDVKAYPWLLPLYFQNKGKSNVLGRRIRRIETFYLEKLAAEIRKVFGLSPRAAAVQARLLTACRLGLANDGMQVDEIFVCVRQLLGSIRASSA